MSAPVLHVAENNAERMVVAFRCPGCGEAHRIPVKENGQPWGWNGSLERPTFSPSIVMTTGHYIPGHNGKACWCTYNAERPDQPAPFTCERCHSFVVDGQIQFLNDCTHALAGQTVPLEPWE